jgi:hypothetical protein
LWRTSHSSIWFSGLKGLLTNLVTGDEVKDPSRKVPLSMLLSVVLNGIFQLAMVILLLFTIGDPLTTLETPTGYPIIQILYGATNSYAGTVVLMAILMFNGMVAMFSSLASVSRLTWAFARDKGLPFSGFLGHVSYRRVSPPALHLTHPPGLTNPPYPAQRPRSRHHHRRPPHAHQPRLRNRALRNPISLLHRPHALLRPPHYLLRARASAPRPHPIRAVPPWQVRPPDQHLCDRVRFLYICMAAVSAVFAGHAAEYELEWAGVRGGYYICGAGLGDLRKEEVCRAG